MVGLLYLVLSIVFTQIGGQNGGVFGVISAYPSRNRMISETVLIKQLVATCTVLKQVILQDLVHCPKGYS